MKNKTLSILSIFFFIFLFSFNTNVFAISSNTNCDSNNINCSIVVSPSSSGTSFLGKIGDFFKSIFHITPPASSHLPLAGEENTTTVVTPPTTIIQQIAKAGLTGNTGPQGLRGFTGLQGPKGDKGESGVNIDTSSLVTKSFFDRQVDGIFNSMSKNIQGLSNNLSEIINTKSLTVSGNATVGGNLIVTGNITGNVVGVINPSFTLGSIPFQGVSGLVDSNSNFFWDNINSRLGIGTINPTEKLNVIGNILSSGTILGSNISGTNTGDETLTSIKTKLGSATSLADGYLTSSDWNIFSGKQNALGYTPVNNTTTINGHALSSNITVSASDVGLGNVINESKLTMFTSPVFTGTTTATNLNLSKLNGTEIKVANHVYFMGDSITNTTYTNKVQELLGSGWVVYNKGISGNSTTDMLSRFATDVTDNLDADYVVILGGVNDLGGTTSENIEANLQSMYTSAHNAGIKVVAVTILPFKGNTNWTSAKQIKLEEVNNWIKNTAINVDYIVDTYSVFNDPSNDGGLLPLYDNGYGLHLSTTGSEFLATTVYNNTTWILRFNENSESSLLIGNNSAINQDVSTTGSPTFNSVTVTNISAIGKENISNNPAVYVSQLAEVLQDGSSFTGSDSTMSTLYQAVKITASGSHTMGDYTISIKESATLTNTTAKITGYIYSDNAGVPGTLLATGSSTKYGSLTTSYQPLSMGTSYTMTSGTKYWLVLKQSATPTGGNIILDSNSSSNFGATSVDGSVWVNSNVQLKYVIRGLSSGAVYGAVTNNNGLYGLSINSAGVLGNSTNNIGVYGVSTNSIAVYGGSVNDMGVYGLSTNSTGVYGLSTSAYGVLGSSTNSYGVSGTSTNSYAIQALSTNSIGVQGNSINGPASAFNQLGTLTSANISNTMLIHRYGVTNSTGSLNYSGNILQLTDDPTGTGTVTGALISGKIDATTRLNFNPRVADGASAVAYMIDTKDALSNATAKLLSLRNSGVEKSYVGFDGGAYFGGSVGIGTSPSNLLHVTGTPVTGTHVARIANTLNGATKNNGLLILAGNDSSMASSEMITFQRPDTIVIGSISQNSASTVAYNLSSDRRIKDNITDTSFGLADLLKIKVDDFTFISDPNKQKMTGFIAQELNDIYPGAVTTNGDNGTDTLAQDATPWMIDYSKLTPLLVKSIQEMDLKITDISNLATKNTWRDSLIAWFGNTTNGIAKIFVGEINAHDANINNLCVTDANGKTCITRTQLDALLVGAGSSNSGSNGNTDNTENTDVCPNIDGVQTEIPTGDEINAGGQCVVITGGDTGDANENTSDTTAPTITLSGENSITLKVGDNYTEPGATATDDVDASVTVDISGGVDTTTAGTYIVKYNAKDAADNHATEVTRTVTVE